MITEGFARALAHATMLQPTTLTTAFGVSALSKSPSGGACSAAIAPSATPLRAFASCHATFDEKSVPSQRDILPLRRAP